MSASLLRRGCVTAVAVAALAPTTPASAISAAPPARQLGTHYALRAAHAAGWQGSQLSRGRIHNRQYDVDDWGLTVDTGLMLAADGSQPRRLARLEQAVRNHYRDYTGVRGERYAGAIAKTLVLARVLRDDPRDFGSVNVRRQLLRRMADSGRFRDKSQYGDNSNAIGQSYGVIGLARTGGVPQLAVRYLLRQRCRAGYFRLKEAGGTRCGPRSTADVDATALALQALVAARQHGAQVRLRVIGRTADWLVTAQHRNGSFGGGASTAAPNTNSTGVAANALAAVGRHRARMRAAGWVADLQITRRKAGSGPARTDVGAIAYDRTALRQALTRGISTVTRDEFRRATPQAYFALAPAPLNSLRAPR
jgi:hypothetical protein